VRIHTDHNRQTARVVPRAILTIPALCVVGLVGCSGQPSEREVGNARAFEALLTAVSLKNSAELNKDAALIDARHASGDLSDTKYRDLEDIVERARAGDWTAAEKRAYDFRAQFGDRGSYFK
jgi:hypothetical protein